MEGRQNNSAPPLSVKTVAIEAYFHIRTHVSPLPEQWNVAADGIAKKTLERCGIRSNDARYFWSGRSPFPTPSFSIHQDFCPCPVQLLLLAIAFPIVLLRSKNRVALYYLVLLLAIGAIFLLSISWQRWISRLHLPLFMLASPVFAVAAERIGNSRPARAVLSGMIALLWLEAAFISVYSTDRPLVNCGIVSTCNAWTSPREHRQFAPRRNLYPFLSRIVQSIVQERPAKIGLIADQDDWEYPLWGMLRRRMGDEMPRIEHIVKENADSVDAVVYLTLNRQKRPSVVFRRNFQTDPQVIQHLGNVDTEYITVLNDASASSENESFHNPLQKPVEAESVR